METKTLELKDIAGYLPYGVRIFDTQTKMIKIISGCESGKLTSVYTEGIGFCYEFLNKIKPILRPLSDLYKAITHNGKEVCPIVELAKISGYKNVKFVKEKGCMLDRNKYFYFDGTEAYIETREIFETYIDYIECDLYLLFDYLHELKIDYRGLIDAGLAVSVYDLEINPYE